ncbi:hypothetical protein ABZ722_33955 [Streptomyces longwoodensis]|uniref:hypothetical protein n=1 Tax=Streptomyces longwoodensis TaxID=68231 RepID=UPI0034072894
MSKRNAAIRGRVTPGRDEVADNTGCPPEMCNRSPEVWLTAHERRAMSEGDAIVRAFRRWSDARNAWRQEHGRWPTEGLTPAQFRALHDQAARRARLAGE